MGLLEGMPFVLIDLAAAILIDNLEHRFMPLFL